MASVPRRESEAATSRPWPPCKCGRGLAPPMSRVCTICSHELATAFWKLMGLPCIPTELPPAATIRLVQPKPAPAPRRRRR